MADAAAATASASEESKVMPVGENGNQQSEPPTTAQQGVEATKDGWKYTDPATGQTYGWDMTTQQWAARDFSVTASSSSQNMENMRIVNGVWIFTDPKSSQSYKFDNEKKDWILADLAELSKEDESSGESDSDCAQHAGEDDFQFQLRLQAGEERRKRKAAAKKTPALPSGTTHAHGATFKNEDGTYEWDATKKAWIPKIDEDFIAMYQASYGYTPLDTSALEKEVKEKEEAAVEAAKPKLSEKDLKQQRRRDKRIREQQDKTWFDIDEEHNTNVYISGLPSEITPKDFEEFMGKCGLIAKDEKNQFKLKLYTDETGAFKGDGRCCYIKKESVELALDILDESEFRPGYKVHVERAQFSLKGQFDPSKRKKISAKQKKEMKARQEKLFQWRPEKMRGERGKFDNVVVIKNLFDPKEFYANAGLLFDLQELLKAECRKYGEIKKVMIFDLHPEGVASLTFADPEMADNCLTMTDYRQMRGRQVRAERWDGKAKYKVDESDEQRAKRIAMWQAELEKAD